MPQRNLIVGFPKAGKTGALASLLDAGYTLRYLDFDANSASAVEYAQPASRERFQPVACLDKLKLGGDKLIFDGPPMACPIAMRSLNSWPHDGSKAADWGEGDVLVVDSGSVMAESAMRRSIALNGREGKKPQFGDYQASHDFITNFLLHAKSLKCHFIMISHLFLYGPDLSPGDIENDDLAERIVEKKLEGAENVPWKLAPKTVGKALHDMAKHFTGVIYVKAKGPVRKLLLRPADGIDAGVPVAGLPPELDITTGLAKIFGAAKESA